MSLLISDAWAAEAPAGGAGTFDLFFIVVMLVVFYFILIRPQMKRAKEHTTLVDSLVKGDEVTTGGGLLGKVIQVGDNYVLLEIAENLEVKIQKQAISARLQKGTIKKVL